MQAAQLRERSANDAAAVAARVRGVVGACDSVNAELRRQLADAAARLAAAEGVLERQRAELCCGAALPPASGEAWSAA